MPLIWREEKLNLPFWCFFFFFSLPPIHHLTSAFIEIAGVLSRRPILIMLLIEPIEHYVLGTVIFNISLNNRNNLMK